MGKIEALPRFAVTVSDASAQWPDDTQSTTLGGGRRNTLGRLGRRRLWRSTVCRTRSRHIRNSYRWAWRSVAHILGDEDHALVVWKQVGNGGLRCYLGLESSRAREACPDQFFLERELFDSKLMLLISRSKLWHRTPPVEFLGTLIED
ncbi:hypothetical protein [Ensifer aridi]|uniref:hypothetical protein n=1 Tax=Ensifer aridi TaxID=1708715 RepID=UPI000A1157E2|nr:hypothetical protein [Ensifer aridi]